MLFYERDFETFFSHIKQKIGDVEIIFGSDEEKAINKAIHNVFQTPHICFVRNTWKTIFDEI